METFEAKEVCRTMKDHDGGCPEDAQATLSWYLLFTVCTVSDRQRLPLLLLPLLDAYPHLYRRVCPSFHRSVGPKFEALKQFAQQKKIGIPPELLDQY